MRKLISIAFIGILTLSFSVKLSIIASYLINQSYYANVLCENKDKPKSGCNGKCHLSKELQSADSGTDKQIPESLLKYEISLFLINKNNPIKISKLEIQNLYSEYIEIGILSDFNSDIFHPPTA